MHHLCSLLVRPYNIPIFIPLSRWLLRLYIRWTIVKRKTKHLRYTPLWIWQIVGNMYDKICLRWASTIVKLCKEENFGYYVNIGRLTQGNCERGFNFGFNEMILAKMRSIEPTPGGSHRFLQKNAEWKSVRTCRNSAKRKATNSCIGSSPLTRRDFTGFLCSI